MKNLRLLKQISVSVGKNKSQIITLNMTHEAASQTKLHQTWMKHLTKNFKKKTWKISSFISCDKVIENQC